jgi:hypothetical protein
MWVLSDEPRVSEACDVCALIPAPRVAIRASILSSMPCIASRISYSDGAWLVLFCNVVSPSARASRARQWSCCREAELGMLPAKLFLCGKNSMIRPKSGTSLLFTQCVETMEFKHRTVPIPSCLPSSSFLARLWVTAMTFFTSISRPFPAAMTYQGGFL